MTLLTLIKERINTKSIVDQLESYLRALPNDSIEDGWHPSQFCGMCPRREVLRIIHNKGGIEYTPNPRLRRIYDYGSMIHLLYQRYFSSFGILWGRWECSQCKNIHWGYTPNTTVCGISSNLNCNWKYKEVPVRMPIGNGKVITGKCDGILWYQNRNVLLEIKSMGNEEFKKLSKPKTKHILQAEIYMELLRKGFLYSDIMKSPKISEILFLYVNKNGPIEKEFLVISTPSIGNSQVELPKQYEEYFIGNILPKRKEACDKISSTIPKKCSVSSECFFEEA